MYKSLKACRAIAAMLVVLFHLGGTLAKEKYFGLKALEVLFSFGNAGVEFFFVLSGFIILTAHTADIGQPGRVFQYARKRLLRIFPTYWLIFLSLFTVAILVPSLRDSVPHDVSTIVQSLLLIPQDKAIVGGTGAPVLVVAWTLQYEMLFYLFFAALVVNVRLATFLGIAVLCCHAVGVVVGVDNLSFPLSFLARDYPLLFAMGMLVAWAVAGGQPLASRMPWLFISLGLVGLAATTLDVVLGTNVFDAHRTLLYGLAASLLVFGLVTSEKKGCTYLGHKWFQLLGDASYALYLIHFPLISLMCKVAIALHLQTLGMTGAIITFIVIFAVCIVVAVVFHLWVERPIARYFRRS